MSSETSGTTDIDVPFLNLGDFFIYKSKYHILCMSILSFKVSLSKIWQLTVFSCVYCVVSDTNQSLQYRLITAEWQELYPVIK